MNHSNLISSQENTSLVDSFFQHDNITAPDNIGHDVSLGIYITKAVVNCSILPALALVGIIGNILTIIVFYQKKTKNASTLFIICLAVSDLLVLILRFIANMYAIGHFYFMEKMRYVRPNSFFWTVFSYSSQRSGNLYMLAILVERFTAVWFPLKLRLIWTKKTAHVIIAIISLLIMADIASVVDIFLFSMNEEIPEQGIVSTSSEGVRYITVQSLFVSEWSFIFRVALDMLPHPVIFIFNILLLIGIRRSLVLRKGLTANVKQRKDGEQTKTRMLLGVSLSYIFLNSPYYVYVYLVVFNVIRRSDVPTAVYEPVKMLNLMNNVINFVVYGVNDKALRGKYLKLLGCRSDATLNVS